ncbi:flagellar biosynthetic protein FliO [Parasulfuritortus cantonensis]|uniref:Flagellar protein n=1 Tax=Parasulfuritortus cantonensis TaxID=2528202 RepID=A0A4R1B9B7_9PROT|nr:flagellar biosynthetic protein FliO [Parasulfuritortus cantonensis]TCJ13469.1 flagellar biosynthetic protein FliO [Parasulfuritortus cantonensis]
MTLPRGSVILLSGMMPLAARAADAVPQTSSFGAFMQALVGLLVVLGMLYGFFWLLRRFGPGQGGAQGVVKVVGGVMLGPRERVVVVEVQDTWILVGVAAGHVSTLHTLAKPEGVDTTPQPVAPPFADKLADLLRRPRA